MRRWAILLYGLFCYLFFFGVFLYAVGFMGNLCKKLLVLLSVLARGS